MSSATPQPITFVLFAGDDDAQLDLQLLTQAFQVSHAAIEDVIFIPVQLLIDLPRPKYNTDLHTLQCAFEEVLLAAKRGVQQTEQAVRISARYATTGA